MTPRGRLCVARRVEFADTDASGRIHFTAVFRWAEETEHALLRTCGVRDVSRFPRVAVDASYHAALAFGTEFVLELRLMRVGRTSLGFDWRGFRGHTTYFDGHHSVVHVDEVGRPAALPSGLADELTHHDPTSNQEIRT